MSQMDDKLLVLTSRVILWPFVGGWPFTLHVYFPIVILVHRSFSFIVKTNLATVEKLLKHYDF